MKSALITGINGQVGSYLAELLVSKGYCVHGLVRRTSGYNLQRIEHIKDHVMLHSTDLLDQGSLTSLLGDIRPQEVYNLAAQSFVGASWETPVATGEVTGLGTTRVLEAIRRNKLDTRFYQASSSEQFGNSVTSPQNEDTPFKPRSPYAVAKVYAHHITVNYRESFGMFNCCGICFNHESPRRGLEFVTRKITNTLAKIHHKKVDKLRLGNLDSKRDWGHARDYAEAMWMMLQHDQPDDYVVATGETHSVRDFLNVASKFAHVHPWSDYVTHDPAFSRPAEVNLLLGDSSKIRSTLGWKPKTAFGDLVHEMVNADLLLEDPFDV